MKLYTEEQVRKVIEMARITYTEELSVIENRIIDSQTPIELPSDEEIEESTRTKSLWDCSYETNFRRGAKWMKEQILNQNK